VLNLTGAGWSFVEDLSRTAGFEPALDKMGTALTEFISHFSSPPLHLNQMVDLQAHWDGAPGGADAYIEGHYVAEEGKALALGLRGVQFNGAGVRFNFLRGSQSEVPDVVRTATGVPFQEIFDLRIEPLFANKECLFLQATGVFPPTAGADVILDRARFVRDLLSNQLAHALRQD
jgi:hypothetical protein